MTDEEILSHIRLLFPTGAETTSSAIGSLLYVLLADDARWKKAVEQPGWRAEAIEELLPRTGPVYVIELTGGVANGP